MKKIALLAAGAAIPAGIAGGRIRAEATGDPKAMFEELNRAVQALRETDDERIKAKADDVVVTGKIETINAAISDLQAALAEQSRKIEAAKIGGGNGRQIADPEYSNVFNALIRGELHESDQKVRASLNKSTDASGGIVAPVEWDRSIVDKVVEVSPFRALATVVQIGKAGYTKVANLRGTGSGWVGETAARPETTSPTFGEIPIFFGEVYANPTATEQMLADAEFDIEAWMAGEIALEFAKAEGTAFVSGNGTNRPAGFLAYVTGGAKAGANPIGNIGTVAGGHASLVNNPDKIFDLVTQLPGMYRPGASFVMNRLTEGALRVLKDTTNNYLWQPSLAVDKPSTLLGHPIAELPDMPDIAANAMPIAFGNFAVGYEIAERSQTAILRDPYTNKPYVHFYATKRVGGGVKQPEAIKILRVAAS